MRIAYCTNVRLPSERAHGHQIAKVTQALFDAGHDVEIFAPFRKNVIKDGFGAYYGLSSPVQVRALGTTDFIRARWAPGVLGLLIQNYTFARALHRVLMERRHDFDLIYTRTPELLSVLTDLTLPVIAELHKIPRTGLSRFLRALKRCKLVVALTGPMRTELVNLGVLEVPIIVEGDAVDLHDFEGLPSKAETRSALRVPNETPLIVYAGQLKSMGLSKGVPELVAALSLLHERGLEFRAVIAGGPEKERQKFVSRLSDELQKVVSFPGHLSHLKIPTLLTAADVLVYPAPKSDHPFYLRDTSPLKLFEYMASGIPVVAADLPTIRDIADDTMLTLVPPGNPEALAEGIRHVLEEPEETMVMATVARKHIENFTWEKRMKRILDAARLDA